MKTLFSLFNNDLEPNNDLDHTIWSLITQNLKYSITDTAAIDIITDTIAATVKWLLLLHAVAAATTSIVWVQ